LIQAGAVAEQKRDGMAVSFAKSGREAVPPQGNEAMSKRRVPHPVPSAPTECRENGAISQAHKILALAAGLPDIGEVFP
jgi:hypothetical protein